MLNPEKRAAICWNLVAFMLSSFRLSIGYEGTSSPERECGP
jgi:hypothetical protein